MEDSERGTKVLVVRINGCRDCPFITDRKVEYNNEMRYETHPHCSKTGTDLFTGCEAIPIPNNCPLPDPVWATVAKKDFK